MSRHGKMQGSRLVVALLLFALLFAAATALRLAIWLPRFHV